jgi:hypothetical protein
MVIKAEDTFLVGYVIFDKKPATPKWGLWKRRKPN